MKRFLFSFVLGLIVISVFGQTWTYEEGSNAFDGSYKTSSIVGIGNEFPYTNPLFVINVFKGDVKNPNIYLTKVPSGVCDNNKVLIKFDNTDKVYEPEVTISSDNAQWFLDFHGNGMNVLEEVTDSIKKLIQYYILSTDKTLKIQSQPHAGYEITYNLSQKDTIDIIYLDSPYWVCRNKNKIVYVHEMYILSGIQKYSIPRVTYVPYKTLVEVESYTEFNLFIEELKVHSLMHVRLQNDCVKSDFNFSLKGSTAALNFVFSK